MTAKEQHIFQTLQHTQAAPISICPSCTPAQCMSHAQEQWVELLNVQTVEMLARVFTQVAAHLKSCHTSCFSPRLPTQAQLERFIAGLSWFSEH